MSKALEISAAFEAALTIFDLTQSQINLFIIICVAFGGWCLASDRIATTPRLSAVRKWVAAIFVVSAGSIAYSIVGMLGRVNTALELARTDIPAGSEEPIITLFGELYGNIPLVFSVIALVLTVVLTASLILLYKALPQCPAK